MRNRIADTSELGILVRQNIRLARRWVAGQLRTAAIDRLRGLTETFQFSFSRGDLHYLDGGWYITHAGLLRLAQRRRCVGIRVQQVPQFCDPVISRWVFKATVYTSPRRRDLWVTAMPIPRIRLPSFAAPRCASPKLAPSTAPCEKPMESASALSKSWDGFPSRRSLPAARRNSNGFHARTARMVIPARLRDQLCLLIRQYNLDPTLVKAYAADFCGTETLKER